MSQYCRRSLVLLASIQLLCLKGALSQTANCLSGDQDHLTPDKDSRYSLYFGQQNFTVNLLDAINRATPNENIFFSPYSTYHALLLAYFGAKSQTEENLKNALHLQWARNKFEVMQAYRLEKVTRLRNAARKGGVDFAAADKIYVAKSVELGDCIQNLFKEEVETLDFAADPELARVQINQWVSNVTKDQIKDILQPGTIDTDTQLALANAAYFKGTWKSKFDASVTKKEIFYSTAENQTFVDMMYQTGTFNYALNERLGCHVLEIPYDDNNTDISMVIFLPPFIPNGLDDVLKRLTPNALQMALEDGMPREIELKLPRFSFEKTYEFLPVLSKLGVGDLFSSKSDLSGFSETQKLHLGDAVHKAKIEVNEDGATAAAATVLFSFRSARPVEPAQFFCVHPFMFLIYDSKAKAVLFAGIYRGDSN